MSRDTRDRRLRWPDYAGEARRRTEETAEDYRAATRRLLAMLRDIEGAAYDNPALVAQLAVLAQRDAALIELAFADIQRWMLEAARGRPKED